MLLLASRVGIGANVLIGEKGVGVGSFVAGRGKSEGVILWFRFRVVVFAQPREI